MEATTMSTLMSDLSAIVSSAITNVGTIAQTITETPILLLMTGIVFLGACVGIFGRLLSRG